MADAPPGGAPAAPPAENLPEFKAPTVAAPPTIQGADAAYNEQVGKIEFQLGNQLAGDKETFTNAQTAYNYNKALYAQKLPGEVGTQRFRAALGGWANSGFEARGQGKIQAGFVNRNTANLTKFQETANKVNREAGQAYGARGIALQGAVTAAEGRFKARQIKNAPQTPEPPITVAGGGPPGSSVTAGPGSPQQPLKFGFAAAERAERPLKFGFGEAERREAAARKARKR